jgi:hypothetical protein
MKDGRRFGGPPKPYTPPEIPDGKVNLTDPDSKHIKANDTYVQGYNAQAVIDEGQIVLAAEITNSTVDWSQLDPMVTATITELERAGVTGRPETAIRGHPVLERAAHGRGDRQQARPGADPARLRDPRHAAARLDRRPLQLDAIGPGERTRRAAIPKTQTYDRTRIRSHQTQQGRHPVSPTRQDRRAYRVAITDGNPQSHQPPPPPNRHRRGLRRPREGHTANHNAPGTSAADGRWRRHRRRTFERQPRPIGGVSRGPIEPLDRPASERRQTRHEAHTTVLLCRPSSHGGDAAASARRRPEAEAGRAPNHGGEVPAGSWMPQ